MTTTGFMQAIDKYYGQYRGDGAAEAVRRWLESKKLSDAELSELFARVVERISGQYRNVPDVAQLAPLVNELVTSRPPKKQLPDPNTLPKEEAAARMSEIFKGLTTAKRHRRKDSGRNKITAGD